MIWSRLDVQLGLAGMIGFGAGFQLNAHTGKAQIATQRGRARTDRWLDPALRDPNRTKLLR
jgi:hypothetical protein